MDSGECLKMDKGYKTKFQNYRGMTKVYERVLERRLRGYVEQTLREWEHGFRSYRSTMDFIFS